MHATCLYCHGSLGRNDEIERFPIGRRLAFDARRGRLWAVCPRCARWNLTPLEERWEAIEDCERRFRASRTRVSTENVGLARLRSGLDLVRIGSPLLPEFAAWRYGRRFRARRLRARAAAGVGAVAAVAALPAVASAIGGVAGLGLLAGTVMYGPLLVPPAAMLLDLKDRLQWERVVARVRAPDGALLTVRAKHAHASAFYLEPEAADASLRLLHDDGATRLEGAHALRAGGALLARANWLGGAGALVRHAVRAIESAGDGARFLSATAERFSRFRGHRWFAPYRRIGALNLAPVERLALEMAVHEEQERRAQEGELAALQAAWREAEEIAAIADAL